MLWFTKPYLSGQDVTVMQFMLQNMKKDQTVPLIHHVIGIISGIPTFKQDTKSQCKIQRSQHSF